MSFWDKLKQFFEWLLINPNKVDHTELPPPPLFGEKPEKSSPNNIALSVSKTLRRNDESEDVKVLQRELEKRGYELGAIDGIFQDQTEAAVKKFQQDNGLKNDGIAGALTLAKLGIQIKAINTEIPENLNRWKDLAEGTIEFYKEILKPGVLKFDAGYETAIMNVVRRVNNESRYKAAMKKLGFPDFASDGTPAFAFAGFVHNLEASGRFDRNFVNGQPINQKTTIVPKGLGPWPSWEAAFEFGMKYKNITPERYPDLTGAQMLYLGERFNGLGYLKKAQWSPYIGAMSNISLDKGKYTSDGNYDPNAPANGQVGLATALVGLRQLLNPAVQNPKPNKSLSQMILSKNMDILPRALNEALVSYETEEQITNKDVIVLVNFDLNDRVKRSWLIDMKTGDVLYGAKKMAHGTNSDPDKDGDVDELSNVEGSRKSSGGPVLIGKAYASSKFKYARRLYGLAPYNSNIYKRAIVYHSSKYVNDLDNSPIGDSWGCFAQSEATCAQWMPHIEGALLYAWWTPLTGKPVITMT